MGESRAAGAQGRRILSSDVDENGYRRALPERNGADFSTNARAASASDRRGKGQKGRAALETVMDRAFDDREARGLPGWRLALKTIAAFWAFYFFLATTRAFLTSAPAQFDMMPRRLAVALLGAAICVIVYLALRRTARAPLQTNIIVAAILTLPAAGLLSAFNHYMFYVFHPLDALWAKGANEMKNWPLWKYVVDGAFSWYFFIAAWAAIFLAISYARKLRAADQHAAALAREAQEAQLRALRYQINPHFLFNTLNSLSSLVLGNRNDTAEKMLMNLSAFFRTTLAADPTADVPLSEEIGLQRLYLEIEQVRFPERLKVEIDVPQSLMNRRVPVLILQPVVENSVKYGVARSRGAVTVRISAYEEAGRLHLKVNDDGEVGHEDGEEGTGVGLRNVCERLTARFGSGAGCLHGADPDGGYTVHIYLPVVSDE